MGFAEMGICVDHVEILKPACKFTLAMLADRADPFSDAEKTMPRTDGRVECWPSVHDLMRRTCQSRSTVLRQLKELERLEIIEIQKRWTRDETGQARQATSRYIINLPDMLAGRFRANSQGKSVKMTPLPEKGKTAGQGLGVKMTPKQSKGVKNGQSKGVTGDTPYKDQVITTNPSPPSPPVQEMGDGAAPVTSGSAAPRLGEPGGSLEGESLSPARSESGIADAPAGAVAATRSAKPGRHRSAFSAPQDAQIASSASMSRFASGTSQNGVEVPNLGTSESLEDVQNHNGVISEDAQLLSEVLPEAMQAIPGRDRARVVQAIRARLDSGWSREQMHYMLATRELPSHVRHMTALLMARFRDDMPVDEPPSWSVDCDAEDQPQVKRWEQTLPSGEVVTAKDLDMGQVAIDWHAAKAAGVPHAQGTRWSFLDAVDIRPYLTR